eukprot:jgi/Phyca11/14851/fgenesh1_pg.PHYCAscaffold_9_\
MVAPVKMTYRFLGDSGLLVSKLALGSWMYPDPSHTVDSWYEMMKAAFAKGVNFFDSAENYALGHADILMGGAIKKGVSEGVWGREDLVVTAKIFSGIKGFTNGTPNSQGLNRKHLIEGTQGVFESHGSRLCGRDLLPPPRALHADRGDSNVPEGSRFSMEPIQKSMFGGEVFTQNVQKAEKLKAIAEKLGCSLPQLALAWCITNEQVATVLVGASNVSQLEENLEALAFVDKITPEVKAGIDAIVQYVPTPWVDPVENCMNVSPVSVTFESARILAFVGMK